MHSPIKNLFLYLTLAILFLAAFTSANACSGGVNVCCGSGSVGCSGSICKACCGSTCGCFYKKSGGCNTQTTPCVDVYVELLDGLCSIRMNQKLTCSFP